MSHSTTNAVLAVVILLGLVCIVACSNRLAGTIEDRSIDQICPPAETTTELAPISTSMALGRVLYDEDRTPNVSYDPPIAGVKIVVFQGLPHAPESLFSTVTDSDGRFDLTALAPGQYQLLTCLEGWDAVQVVLEVLEDGEEREIVLAIKPS